MLRRRSISASHPGVLQRCAHKHGASAWAFRLAAACTMAGPWVAQAQMHKVAAPERVTRAVGVYEWTGPLDKPTAARLIPVSLFINGHMEDAGLYLARPVPFALEYGNVYSVEKAGESEGLLDVQAARDIVTNKALADDDPVGTWFGYGKFEPPAAARPAKPRQSAHPAVIVASTDDSDDKPHFVTRPGATDTSSTPSTSSGSGTGSTPTADSDRPHMSRAPGSGSDDPASSGSAGSGSTNSSPRTSGTDADPDNDRPTLRHHDSPPPGSGKKNKRGSDSGVIPVGSLNDDPDRPTMRRSQPDEAAGTKELTGMPADLHQAIAVSDAGNREPHIFARSWDSPAEQTQTTAELQKIARAQVADYMKANQLQPGKPGPTPAPAAAGSSTTAAAPQSTADTTTGPPKLQRGVPKDYSTPAASTNKAATSAPPAASKTTASGRTASSAGSAKSRTGAKSKPAAALPIALVDEQITPLTLSYGGLPTFVYTAQSPTNDGGSVYVTVVAQRMPSGELQISLHSTTDAKHLNRVPWMHFVDAVDPDGSHRASLLFELRAQSSRQFALYRLISMQAEQTFATGIIE